jgi:acyl-CoA synthetase (AMP-forming)/AMP-acid ligase II
MPVPIEAETVGQLVRNAAATFGDAEAVVGSGTRLTFRELEERSRALARRLLARGVAKRTHVGVSFGNNPDCLVSMLAVSRIGAVAVPVSTFAPGRELLRLIRYGDLAALLTKRDVVGVDQVDRLADAIPGLAEANGPSLALAAAPSLRWIEFVDADDRAAAWVTRPDDEGIAAPVTDAVFDALEDDVVGADVALMIHTSGTTSDPKGEPHLHNTVSFRARYLAERMQYRPGERTYTSHVLFWIGGLTMSFFTNLAAGGTSVWCERFDAGEVLALIEHERIDRLVIYPHQVEQLLAHPGFSSTDRGSLRIADPRLLVGDGGGIVTPEGHRMALGMSETFGPYSWGSGGTGVIGPIEDVQPGLEVRVAGEDDTPVGDGGTGEILLRGRGVTPGYYKRPKSFGFDPDGWFRTGDRGLVDGDAIHFLGRMTELIKTAGANVAPAEVVDALLAIDGVREAYVLPLPDPLRGEVVSAAVVLDEDRGLDADVIRAELKKDLSPYKVPAVIASFRSEEIPWTPTFKVRRHELTGMILERSGGVPAS